MLGPNADDPSALFGCYSFANHVLAQHPDVPLGLSVPSVLDALRSEREGVEVVHARGCDVDTDDTSGFGAALEAADGADAVVVVLGDRAGLFGRGTSGEGCDADSLALPGAQQQLLDAVLATGTPTIVVLFAGRPYALGAAVTGAAAIVQTFFPGEEGTGAVAGVLSGRVNPSGRLPVSVPAHAGSQPSTYLAAPLARKNGVSNVDPTAAFSFGHGIGYAGFAWSSTEPVVEGASASVTITVTNTGDRAGTDVVQLYLHDPVASVVRPVQRLLGFRRVSLEAGATVTLTVSVPFDTTSFTNRAGVRVVEPGEIVLGFGRSSADIPIAHSVQVTGATREVGYDRALHVTWV